MRTPVVKDATARPQHHPTKKVKLHLREVDHTHLPLHMIFALAVTTVLYVPPLALLRQATVTRPFHVNCVRYCKFLIISGIA